jgi:hypothetical protein
MCNNLQQSTIKLVDRTHDNQKLIQYKDDDDNDDRIIGNKETDENEKVPMSMTLKSKSKRKD